MAEATGLVRDDEYEEMAAAYLCVQVDALDAALRERGVEDAALRRRICETFVFRMGEFHDEGWLRPRPDATAVFPVLCFSTQFLNSDTAVEDLGTLYAPSPMFSFHEYAFGTVDAYYDGNPAARVETGRIGGEDEGEDNNEEDDEGEDDEEDLGE